MIRGGAIGDFILTLPAIKLLREAFPAAHLEILGYKHIVALAQMSGYADATRSIEYGALAGFFARDGELAPDLVEYFAGFQQVISYLFDPDQIFANNLKRAGVRNFIAGSPKVGDHEHAARHLARPLERLGLYLDDPASVIVPNEKRAIDPTLIAIHAGSGSAAKNWPLERFIALGVALLEASEKTRLLLVGGEADADRVARLAASLPSKKVRLLSNRPLPELAAVLQNCALFIGHDSGISHLAAAVGVPSLLLFGPTDPAIWAPTNREVSVLRSPDMNLSGIDVSRVLETAYELMRIGIRT